jgi:signal transduction histidine kinase
VRDFLDFSRARSAGTIPIARKTVNLAELTRNAVEEVRLANPGRTAVVQHFGETTGEWDGNRLAQVIGNLVANAFQHSPGGASVRVTSHVEPTEARISVHNAGPPISPTDRERLFVPFKRGEHATPTEARSVGLGLFIARVIVEAHGGKIDVESNAEAGTTFTVRLPRG